MLIGVIVNTLMISSEGYVSDEFMDGQNNVFTIIFTVEMGMKFVSDGPISKERLFFDPF